MLLLCCAGVVQARLLELVGRLLELPANLDYLLSCGQLLPAFVRTTRVALDHCNSLEADAPSMMRGGEAASRLSMLLQVLVSVLEHSPSSPELVNMQEQLVSRVLGWARLGCQQWLGPAVLLKHTLWLRGDPYRAWNLSEQGFDPAAGLCCLLLQSSGRLHSRCGPRGPPGQCVQPV